MFLLVTKLPSDYVCARARDPVILFQRIPRRNLLAAPNFYRESTPRENTRIKAGIAKNVLYIFLRELLQTVRAFVKNIDTRENKVQG